MIWSVATPHGHGPAPARRIPACLVALTALGVLALASGNALSDNGDRLNDGPGAVLLAPVVLEPTESTGSAVEPLVLCPVNVIAKDVPDDGGGAILITWETGEPPASDADGPAVVEHFEILRFAPGEEPTIVGDAPLTDRRFVDNAAESGVAYQYVVRAVART